MFALQCGSVFNFIILFVYNGHKLFQIISDCPSCMTVPFGLFVTLSACKTNNLSLNDPYSLKPNFKQMYVLTFRIATSFKLGTVWGAKIRLSISTRQEYLVQHASMGFPSNFSTWSTVKGKYFWPFSCNIFNVYPFH